MFLIVLFFYFNAWASPRMLPDASGSPADAGLKPAAGSWTGFQTHPGACGWLPASIHRASRRIPHLSASDAEASASQDESVS